MIILHCWFVVWVKWDKKDKEPGTLTGTYIIGAYIIYMHIYNISSHDSHDYYYFYFTYELFRANFSCMLFFCYSVFFWAVSPHTHFTFGIEIYVILS